MPDKAIIDETLRWRRFAYDDLASAVLLHSSSSVSPGQTCFHAQQAVEKAFKCLLVYLEMVVPKTHDLGFLQRSLPDGMQSHLISEIELDDLSFWAVQSRYPGEDIEASSHDAETALVTARNVLKIIDSDLTANGLILPHSNA